MNFFLFQKMDIKISRNKNSEECFKENKNLDLSSLINKKRKKNISKSENDLKKVNISIKFNINKNHLLDKYERIYYNKYIKYINNQLNSKVISMLFNYISSSNIIPISLKKNCFFIIKILKIIKILFVNEIELVIITLILDKIGLMINDLERHLYYVTLAAKHISSSHNKIFLKILNKNNFGFSENYKQWLKKPDIQEILQKIDLTNINNRFNELRQPFYLNENQKKFINYNEIANIIAKIPNTTNSNKNLNTSIFPAIQSNTNSNNNQNTLLMAKADGFSMNPFDTLSPNPIIDSKQDFIISMDNQIKQNETQNNFDKYLQNNNSLGGISEVNNINAYIPFEQDDAGFYKFI